MMVAQGLVKLIEEMGELTQVVGKKLAYPDSQHPDNKGDLTKRLEDEMADVMAICYFVQYKLKLDANRMAERQHEKFNRYLEWDKESN
jgi:NTP pyrophosphatase (non-canonical NTP hydrolase)